MSSFTSHPPDHLAVRVVHHCARSLAKDIAAVANQAMIKGCEPTTNAGLSVTGGVIKQEQFRLVLAEELAMLGVHFQWIELVDDAAGMGAAAIALNTR
jgi:hexokinase